MARKQVSRRRERRVRCGPDARSTSLRALALDGECATGERGSYSTPHEKTRTGVTSTMTTSDSSSAASSGYCGYFA